MDILEKSRVDLTRIQRRGDKKFVQPWVNWFILHKNYESRHKNLKLDKMIQNSSKNFQKTQKGISIPQTTIIFFIVSSFRVNLQETRRNFKNTQWCASAKIIIANFLKFFVSKSTSALNYFWVTAKTVNWLMRDFSRL